MHYHFRYPCGTGLQSARDREPSLNNPGITWLPVVTQWAAHADHDNEPTDSTLERGLGPRCWIQAWRTRAMLQVQACVGTEAWYRETANMLLCESEAEWSSARAS
jgi:hypothetical protein